MSLQNLCSFSRIPPTWSCCLWAHADICVGVSIRFSLWVSRTGNSDSYALQEALYKCIDTIQYHKTWDVPSKPDMGKNNEVTRGPPGGLQFSDTRGPPLTYR